MNDFCVQDRKQIVELKVCEGCGALWLRPAMGEGVRRYCQGCVHWLKEFPAPQSRSRRGRRKGSGTWAAGCSGLHVVRRGATPEREGGGR